MIPLALAVPYFHLKMERLQTCRLRCLLVRCCEMGRAAVDQAVSSSTGEVVLANFTIHEGEPWLINDRGAGLEATGHDNCNFISKNGDILSLKFERAGFSDHMVPENLAKYYFIQHFRFIKSVWPRFLLLVLSPSHLLKYTSSDAEESGWHWKHCGKPGVWCNPIALQPRCQNWFHFSEPWIFERQKWWFEVYMFSSKVNISKYHEVTRCQNRSWHG